MNARPILSTNGFSELDAPDIRHVLGNLYPPSYQRRLILMLRAFLDASAFGRVLAIAGFVGSVDGWSRFQKTWRRARQEAGIEYFRMTDFMSGKAPPYRAWSQKKRDAVMSRLLGLINECTSFGVAMAINLDDYQALNPAHRKYTSNNPYSVCAGQCVGTVAKVLDDNAIAEQIFYVFESGDVGHPQFRESMARIVTSSERFRERFHVYGVTPGTKKQYPGLDSADFLAWEITHHIPKKRPDDPLPLDVSELSERMRRVSVPVYNNYLRGKVLEDWAVERGGQAIAAELGITFGRKQRKRHKSRVN